MNPPRQKHRRKQPSLESQHGAALVAVLCLVGVLVILAAGVLAAARRHAHLARNSFELVEKQALADSAIRLAMLDLGVTTGQNAGISQQRAYEVFGQFLPVDIEDETGRIDLNAAGRGLLTAVFAANDFKESAAVALADRILDWRDADDEQSAHGAERHDYRLADRTDGPRNAPFETVGELRQVLGSERLTEELLDAFTVYTHSPVPSQAHASAVVTRALHWADARQVDGHRWLPELSPAGQSDHDSNWAGKVVRLKTCVKQLCRIAIVRITGNSQSPVQVFAWYSAYQQSKTRQQSN